MEAEPSLETEDGFAMIRYARMMLRDPAGVNTIVQAGDYPAEPYPGTAYLINNRCQIWSPRKKAWETLSPALSDGYILEVIRRDGRDRGIIALIDFIIMGIQAGGATQISAGAESVTLLPPREQLEFLKEKKRILLSQTGLGGGRICKTRRRAIGGVREER
jgi:hypothetical protein